ncbi:MAG: hypothetical protein IKG14_01870 [Clostridia bacterium]|nr:hypothetical protein [Bacilli bacterium]MBR3324782.1 hypothetical protein [Clostridia bacterium]
MIKGTGCLIVFCSIGMREFKGKKENGKEMEENKNIKMAESFVGVQTHTSILNNQNLKIKKTGTIIAEEHSVIYSKQYLQQAGITLVALVVTIIVLLILAGVTISLAMNDNGVMDKAQFASNMYANATKDERVMLEEMEDSIIDLSDSSGIVIKDSDENKINLSQIANYYGKYVNYNGTTDKYQLFYVDVAGKYSNGEPRVWLQYKTYTALPGALGNQYNSSRDDEIISNEESIMWQINPDLDNKYGVIIRGLSSWQSNVKEVAYLSNPENWNDTYLAEGDSEKGGYAIGGVSAELFCDSYNQARGITDSIAKDYFEAKAFKKNSNYGYLYKPGYENAGTKDGDYGSYTDSASYPIQTSICSGIYRFSNSNSQCPWLSSMSPEAANRVCFVYGSALNNGNGAYAYGVRPAVSLPTDIEIQLIN